MLQLSKETILNKIEWLISPKLWAIACPSDYHQRVWQKTCLGQDIYSCILLFFLLNTDIYLSCLTIWKNNEGIFTSQYKFLNLCMLSFSWLTSAYWQEILTLKKDNILSYLENIEKSKIHVIIWRHLKAFPVHNETLWTLYTNCCQAFVPLLLFNL